MTEANINKRAGAEVVSGQFGAISGRVSAQRDEITSASPSKVICPLSDIVSDVDGSHSINGLIGIHPIVVTASDFAAFFGLSRPRGRFSDPVGRLANSGKRGSGT